MMKILNTHTSKLIFATSALLSSLSAQALEVIRFSPTAKDMTPVVQQRLAQVQDDEIKIIFEQGIYNFKPDYATTRYTRVTNHGNGLKNVIFPLENFKSVEIEGNRSELIFHGLTAPFQLYNNNKISVKQLVIDWDIPFTFLSEVKEVNKKQGYIDVKPLNKEHNWTLKDGRILFPNIDGFNYSYLGSSMPWEPETKRIVHGATGFHSHPTLVEQLDNGLLRIHEKLKQFPPVGSWVSSKGDREKDRYAPAFQVKNSQNVTFDHVTVHHALGMGFLFERSEDIQIINSSVKLREGAERVISSTADATHFANCKGHILMDNVFIENMLDDGTNVHGTYVSVDKVIDSHTVRYRLEHFEQLGFEFATVGDQVWFIHQPDPSRGAVNTIVDLQVVNDKYAIAKFAKPIPSQTRQGDVLENKTWNPEFTIRNSVVRDHRARNIVVKTPKKIVIENNYFSSQMGGILLRGETFSWFESGAVQDVLIQNNHFEYNAYASNDQAVLIITPRLGKAFEKTIQYDKNIRFINNTIDTFGNRVVWADRVDGLVIQGNKIRHSIDKPLINKNAPLFEFINSKNVVLEDNHYQGKFKQAIKADAVSAKTLKNDNSIK